MNFSAMVPVADVDATNKILEEAGFGPDNFSVPVYGMSGVTHVACHCWNDPVFQAAVEAIPGVVVVVGEEGEGEAKQSSDPAELVRANTKTVFGVWDADITKLPDKGSLVKDALYKTEEGKVVRVLKPINRDSNPGAPETLRTFFSVLEKPISKEALT
jgi:hypothetical protein